MEENALRLLLIVVGIFVLVGIYFYDKIKKHPKQVDDFAIDEVKVQPVISDDESVTNLIDEGPVFTQIENEAFEQAGYVETSEVGSEKLRASAEELPVVEQAMVVQLIAIPNSEAKIQGVDLLNTFTELNLEFGDMGIFHRYLRDQGVEKKLFHVANLLEPGTFPVGNMSDFETKGLVFFFQVDRPDEAIAQFDEMLESARTICQRFGCEIMNAEMQPLTFEKIDLIRDRLSNN